MEVFNKLYSSVSSTVSSTVSNLSAQLPGNPITREYEVQDFIGSAGIENIWKVYNGFKKSTKESVSIFILEKNKLDKWNKNDKEKILNVIKKGIQQQTKIRHPNFLTIQHQLEESRESLCFATEPIWSNLKDLISNNNLKNESKLFDMEIKHGLISIIEGLIFLHNDMKIVHRNLIPENIILNNQRQWKIFGLDFCLHGTTDNNGSYSWEAPDLNYNTTNAFYQPTLEYMAPEVSLNSFISTDSDIYVLAILIYNIYSNGKQFKYFGNNYKSYQKYCTDLNKGIYPSIDSIPQNLFNDFKRLLHPSPQQRMKLQEFSKTQFFNDVGVQTLIYFDSLYQWDNLQKSKFYKGLNDIISNFPHQVNIYTIIPSLVKEFINPQMIPFVLPNVFLIMQKCELNEYTVHIMPYLNSVMKLHDPIQIPYILMQNINLLLKLTPENDMKLNILPFLYRILDSSNLQLQEMCLNIIPNITKSIDYSSMKNSLVPKIQNLCVKCEQVTITVKCLVCIGKLMENLDKWIINDDILPFLSKIKSRDPAVLMAIIGIYKISFQNPKIGITKDVIALKIIPFIMPMCIEDKLNVTQFNTIVGLLKEMVNKVETEHRSKLQQLNNNQVNLNSTSQSINDLQNDICLDTSLPFASSTTVEPISKPITPAPIVNYNKLETSNNNNKPTYDFSTKYSSQPISKSINLEEFDPFTLKNSISKTSMQQTIQTNNTRTSNIQQLQSTMLKPEIKNNINKMDNSNLPGLSQQDILDFLK